MGRLQVWLVLAELSDVAGMWAYLGLRQRGLTPIEYVLPEELVIGARCTQRLSMDHDNVVLRLKDGREIDGDRLTGVLNRLVTVPETCTAGLSRKDSDYVHQELHAFFMSWIFALPCHVISPPSAAVLSGEVYDQTEWIWMALHADLPVPIFRQGTSATEQQVLSSADAEPPLSRQTVFVVGNDVLTGEDARPDVIEGCLTLAGLAQTPLLGVEFDILPDGGWQFASASPLPDLRLGGNRLLDALASALKRQTRP